MNQSVWGWVLVPLSCLWVGCPDASSNGDAAATGPVASRELTGDRVDNVRPGAATPSTRAADLSGVPVRAHVRQGDGAWRTIDGAGSNDGTFRVSGVPSGDVVLQVGNQLHQVGADTLHLGEELWRRAEPALPTGLPEVCPRFSGLLPVVESTDSWSLDALGVDAHEVYALEGDGTLNNATTLRNICWRWFGPYVESDAGDRSVFAQLRRRTVPGGSVEEVLAMALVSISINRGTEANQPVAELMAPSADTHTLPAVPLARLVEAQRMAAGRGVRLTEVRAVPQTWETVGPRAGALLLRLQHNDEPPANTPDAAAAVPQAPGGFTRVVVQKAMAQAFLAEREDGHVVEVSSGLMVVHALDAPAPATLVDPLLGLKVGATPMVLPMDIPLEVDLSWDAFTGAGAPTAVRVVFHRVLRTTRRTRLEPAVTLTTRGNAVHVPAGLLEDGADYMVELTAVLSDGADALANPNRLMVPPYSAAIVWTPMLTARTQPQPAPPTPTVEVGPMAGPVEEQTRCSAAAVTARAGALTFGPTEPGIPLGMELPPAAGYQLVARRLAGPDSYNDSGTTTGNTVVLHEVFDPSGTAWLGPLGSGINTALGVAAPSHDEETTALFPNTADALEVAAGGGVPAGLWNASLDDGLFFASPNDTRVRAQELTVFPLQRRPGGRLDLDVVVVANALLDAGLDAAHLATQANTRRWLGRAAQLLSTGGITLGKVRFRDAQPWMVDTLSMPTGGVPGCDNESRLLSLGDNPDALTVFLVDDAGNYLGRAGGIPGPAGMVGLSSNGVVVVSAELRFADACPTPQSVYCGPDVIGLTLAHEIGHFSGLFHTTEINAGANDPLTDTAQCAARCAAGASELSPELCDDPGTTAVCGGGLNVMFPINQPGRVEWSTQQGEVLVRMPLLQQVAP